MMYDNVLEESNSDKIDFRECKLNYLKAENNLLNLQLTTVAQLVDLYKQILDLVTKEQPTPQTEAQIEKLLQSALNKVDECFAKCEEMIAKRNLFPEDEEGIITPSFFMELVLSFESTIAELKQSIHHRQTLLQELEINKDHPKIRRNETESKAVIKAIQSYDIYPRLSEKCKEEIKRLKNERKSEKNPLQERNNQSNFMVSPDKTVKKLPRHPDQAHFNDNTVVFPVERMSPFEKVILIYKKKKLFNQILQSRVLKLKNKIHEKEICNKILRNKLQKSAWDIGKAENHRLEDGEATFLSVLNQSLKANNLDFSVDISRVRPINLKQEEEQDDGPTDKILQGIEQMEFDFMQNSPRQDI